MGQAEAVGEIIAQAGTRPKSATIGTHFRVRISSWGLHDIGVDSKGKAAKYDAERILSLAGVFLDAPDGMASGAAEAICWIDRTQACSLTP